MSRLRMHAELRDALDGNKAAAEFERLRDAAETTGRANEQLTEELDDTKTWLQRAMQERGQVERELVLEVKRLKDELTMARVSLANEGAETRARLAKADISAQRAERRMMREKEHCVRLQRTMDAVVRAIDKDRHQYDPLAAPNPGPTGFKRSNPTRMGPGFELPDATAIPDITRCIIDVEIAMDEVLSDVKTAVVDHDVGNPEEDLLDPIVPGTKALTRTRALTPSLTLAWKRR